MQLGDLIIHTEPDSNKPGNPAIVAGIKKDWTQAIILDIIENRGTIIAPAGEETFSQEKEVISIFDLDKDINTLLDLIDDLFSSRPPHFPVNDWMFLETNKLRKNSHPYTKMFL